MANGSAGETRLSLLSRLRRDPNDASAWDEFVGRYGPQIVAWCRRWGLQEADAQDVTQMVLVRLAAKLRTFVYDPSRSFRAWLKTLARHAWSDFVSDRSRAVEGSGGTGMFEALHTVEARDDLERHLEEAFDLELLQVATANVRECVEEHTWEAFRLTAMDGLSGAEAAARLGMAVASVFKAKSNVQKRLRDEIARLEEVRAMTDCPARQELLRLLNGDLVADVERDVSAHLEICLGCQQVLEELTAVQAAVGPATPPPGGPAARVGDSQLQRLRGLLPPGSMHPSAEMPALAAVTWPAVPGYEVLRELGRGGMAVVYEARQLRLNRLVALKMIRAGDLASPEQLVRFCAEGEIVARLRHPNIVQIYEVGSHDRRPYLALELMEGGNLSEALGGKPLPARAAGELVEALAGATEYAHRQGVVHRDLNPANVLLSGNREQGTGNRRDKAPSLFPKIADFGLAKHLGQDSRLTQTGFVMGTPGYMAPEQVRGAKDVGPAADVYALGAILYECLTGRPPFLAATALETMRQVAEADPLPPTRLLPQVPRDLEVVCLKCLEKEPARRYPGAGELADDLRRFLAGEPIRARRIDTLERAWRWARRRPAVAGLLLALVVALLAGTGFSTYFAVEERRRAAEARQKEGEATEARDVARAARDRADQQSAELLLDRGLKLAREGRPAEALHWMLAALRASPEADFRRQVRTHLAGWGGRVPTLTHWLDTPHRNRAFGPDGRCFLTAGLEGGPTATIRLWDLRSGRPLGDPIVTDQAGIQSVSFSPDGRALLAASSRFQSYQYKPGWAQRWGVAERRSLGRSLGHTSTVECAVWTPDGKQFLTGSWDGTLRAWEADGRPAGRPLKHPGRVDFLACSPDGRWVLTFVGGTVFLWEVATGWGTQTRGPADLTVQSVAFGPDSKTLLVAGRRDPEKTPWLWTGHWDAVRRELSGEPEGRPAPATVASFLPDGTAVPAEGQDGSADGRWAARVSEGIQLWRRARGCSRPAAALELPRPAADKPGTPLLPAHFAAGPRVWTALGDVGVVQAWDLATGQPAGAPVRHTPMFDCPRLATGADGRAVATVAPGVDGGEPAPAWLWDAATGHRLGPPLPQENAVLALAFSPDGRLLATGGHAPAVRLWSVPDGRLLDSLPGGLDMDLAFAPDGKSLAVGAWGRVVRLWDLAPARERASLPHEEPVERVGFSPDGARLLALGWQAAYLWDPHAGQKIATLSYAKSVADARKKDLRGLFSPDGKTVLTSSGYGSFRLWRAADGQPLGPPTPPGEAQLSCFAFSPDSRLAVAGHEDGTAQVWDVATSRPLGAPAVQPAGVTGVAFTPDGDSFLTVAADGTIRSWPVPAPLEGDDELVALSVQLSTGLRMDEGRAVVSLTRAEWEELRRRWREREGDADWAVSPPASDEDWHDARARDAEETGHAFTARWHLDRLIAARPDDGRLYLRRARTHTDEGRWDEADADYRRARAHGPEEAVLAWYRHRAWACQARGQWSAAQWYLDRLLAAQPDDQELRQRRSAAAARLAEAKE